MLAAARRLLCLLSQFLDESSICVRSILFKHIARPDQQDFEVLHLDIKSMQMSGQFGKRQHFVRELESLLLKLGISPLRLFDLLARFCARFFLILAHLSN
jgi:hypothetical protein